MKITGQMKDISHFYTNLCPTRYEFYELLLGMMAISTHSSLTFKPPSNTLNYKLICFFFLICRDIPIFLSSSIIL